MKPANCNCKGSAKPLYLAAIFYGRATCLLSGVRLTRVEYLCVCCCCSSVKASHVLISADGQVCMSGLRSIFSLIRHGQRAKVVHDFPSYSVKVLPWLSPEVLQQVGSITLHLSPFPADHCCSSLTACLLPRTCRATTSVRTSTAWASQPVSWPMATFPLRTCQLLR